MSKKQCFKCGDVKWLHEFYKHPQMADGHLNKRKECTKADVKTRYVSHPEKNKAYEKARANLPHRITARKEYAQTENGKAAFSRGHKRYITNKPDRYIAHTKVGNAIRDGKLTRQPCEVCGAVKTEAHHTDYTKPFDVSWLCRTHHLEAHGKSSLQSFA